MSDKKFLEVKSKEKFYLNDKRFYVFYKENGESEPSLLSTDYFDIKETEVGYEILVKKIGGYVGMNIPIFSDLIVGNQFSNVEGFNRQRFCYNKVRFDGSYKFPESDFTDIYYPIFHNIISNDKTLSVSPSSEEEVIIRPYSEYFDNYAEIQTYSHYKNDYVRFFLDISVNYHLNLRRVSESLNDDSVCLDTHSSIIEYQDVLYNNFSNINSNRDTSTFKTLLRVFIPFIENIVGGKLVFQGDFSLWLNNYMKTLPKEIEAISGLKGGVNFNEVRVKLLNKVDSENNWIDKSNIDLISKEDSLIRFDFDNIVINVSFSSKKWDNYDDRVNHENKIVYLKPEAELERRILDYQSVSSDFTSKKKSKKLRQRVEKLAWKVKKNDEFFNSSLLNLISNVSNKQFSDYFKSYFNQFSFRDFKLIRERVLKNVKQAFLDVRINKPLFVSIFEDMESYYFVVVNPNCVSENFRMIVGVDFYDGKWIGLKRNGSSKVRVESFMEHREVYVNDVKFGGVLIVSKNE